MEGAIEKAILLRKSGKFEESRSLLFDLLSNAEFGAKVHLHIAWSYDNEGKEQEAIFHYQTALLGPLTKNERFDALFGLASTLRSLGEYEKALIYFEQTISEFPDSAEVQPFYAMCLYNLGRNKEAVALLLELLVSTTDNAAIKDYKKAITLYAKDLDRKW